MYDEEVRVESERGRKKKKSREDEMGKERRWRVLICASGGVGGVW